MPDINPASHPITSIILSNIGKTYFAIAPTIFNMVLTNILNNDIKPLVIFIKFSSVPPPAFNPATNSSINVTNFTIGSKSLIILYILLIILKTLFNIFDGLIALIILHNALFNLVAIDTT